MVYVYIIINYNYLLVINIKIDSIAIIENPHQWMRHQLVFDYDNKIYTLQGNYAGRVLVCTIYDYTINCVK